MPGCDGAGTAEKSYPSPRSGAAAERSYPASEVRGGGQEELPHAPAPEARGGGQENQSHQGAAVAQAHEGLEELSRRTAVRRYPLSKVRSSGCTLLQQP